MKTELIGTGVMSFYPNRPKNGEYTQMARNMRMLSRCGLWRRRISFYRGYWIQAQMKSRVVKKQIESPGWGTW